VKLCAHEVDGLRERLSTTGDRHRAVRARDDDQRATTPRSRIRDTAARTPRKGYADHDRTRDVLSAANGKALIFMPARHDTTASDRDGLRRVTSVDSVGAEIGVTTKQQASLVGAVSAAARSAASSAA